MGALSASFQDLSEGLAVEYWIFMVALTILVYFIQGCDHPWSVVYFREFWAIWTKSREFSIVLSQVRMVVIKMSKDPSSWLRSPSAGWVSVQGMGIYSISLWDAFSLLFFFHFLPRKMQRVLFFTPLDKLPQDKLNPVYSPVVLCNQFFFKLSFQTGTLQWHRESV